MDSYHNAVTDVTRALPSALGDDFLALYLHEGVTRNLWLFVRPEAEMKKVRDAFLPLWKQYAGLLKRGPIVISPTDFSHYRLLFPSRARDLCDRARLLAGEAVWAHWPEPLPLDPLVQLAEIAAETLRCSALLALNGPQVELERELFQVVSQQAGLDVGPGTPPRDMLEALYTYLAAQSEDYPAYGWDGAPPADAAPARLPGLLALVGLKYQLIGVMPRVDRSVLNGIDWPVVVELVTSEFTSIGLATPWQLRLVSSVALAQDLYLHTFEPLWGSNLLGDCNPSQQHVMRCAAELPVRGLVEQLSPAYMTADEEELGDLIHDVQNALLNIQLRNELTARVQGVAADCPPEPLPGREAPIHQRLAANFYHLRWWSEYLVAGWQKLLV
jgi:hypothetical protein